MNDRERYEDILFNPYISVQQVVVVDYQNYFVEELRSEGSVLARLSITSEGPNYWFKS